MEVCFLASGQGVAVLEAAEVEGKSAKAVKQALAAKIGVTRFRQKLFLEGDGGEIPDDEIFSSVPPKLQLVVLEFCPANSKLDKQMKSAARNNDTVGLQELLKGPRSPNARDAEGKSLLYHAADQGHVEPMRLLLEAGAEIDAPGSQLFGEAPLHKAAEGGHLEAVRLLVQSGAQKDVLDAIRRTPLGLAVLKGHVGIARFLVEEGANKDEIFNKRHGTTALHTEAEDGNLTTVRFLVEIGCDKDAIVEFGGTPLHRAAEADRLDIVRFLVESGACRHSTDEDGKTALDLASESGHAEVVRFLSEFEAESPSRKVPRVGSNSPT